MSALQKLIPLDAPMEWNAALEGIPHAFGHTWAHCHALYQTTGLSTYLYHFEQGAVRIVCPIWEREFLGETDIATPYGFSGFSGTRECPDFPSYWTEFARSRGYVCGYLGMHPLLWRESYARAEEVYHYNHIYVLDLSLSSDELLAKMAKGRRHQLRAWARSSARLCEDREALAAFCLRNHAPFLTARKASRASYLSAGTIARLAASRDVFLLGAAEGGAIQAAILVAHTPAVGEALFLISVPGGEQHSAPLFWHAALRLKELGVPLMSMGGGVRENDGVAKFKQHFGTQRVPMISLKQVYDAATFGVLCRRTDTDPQERSGYFPPYRAP